MAAASQVSQHKRERDDCWNGGLPLQDTKRINCGLTVARDSDLMAFFDQIDNFDANGSNPEGTDAANELEICEIGMNGVLKSLEDELGLKVQTEKIEWIDEKGDADRVGSIKRDKFTVYGSNSEATSAWDIGDWTYYDDLRAELRYFVEDISPQDLGFIIDNYTFGDSTYDIMYFDTVHSCVETTDDFFASLWDQDIWQWNEHPIIRNDFESSQQEVGLVVSEAEFSDVLERY